MFLRNRRLVVVDFVRKVKITLFAFRVLEKTGSLFQQFVNSILLTAPATQSGIVYQGS